MQTVILLSIIKGLRRFLVLMPVIVVFFQSRGLSVQEIMMLQAIFSIVIVVCEVPSGYLSDVWGRKRTLVSGMMCLVIGMMIYSFAHGGFVGFVFAELCLGIGASLLSGTDSAILYDTLLARNNEDMFMKYQGRLNAISNFSESIAALVGSAVATVSLLRPAYIQTGAIVCAMVLTLCITEPPRPVADEAATRDDIIGPRDGNPNPLQQIRDIVVYSLHGHREIKRLILYSALISAATLVMTFSVQPYWTSIGVPIGRFGVLRAGFNASIGVFALWAHRIEGLLGRRGVLIGLIVLIGIGYASLGAIQTIWGLVPLVVFYLVRGVSGPVISDYVNRHVRSDMRATVLSVKNMVFRGLFAIIAPFVGRMIDLYSISQAFWMAAGLFVVFGAIALLFLKKNNALS